MHFRRAKTDADRHSAGKPIHDVISSMPAHKFSLGQKVRFSPDMGQLANRGEDFIVVRQLPESAGVRQYQIKSQVDGHLRVSREDQLLDL